MKINELQTTDIKRISSVTIRPTTNLVEITGKNAQGKSSLLDSILWALDGAEHIQAEPIRKGADKATIRLDMGEVIVTRKFRRATSKDGSGTKVVSEVIVEAANGARFQKPQQMLDSFLGSLTFDPYGFTQRKPAEQFEQLKRFVPGVDFAAIDGKNKTDYEARTEANRDARNARAAAESIVIPEGTPEVPIDEEGLVRDLAAAGQHNADINTRKENREKVAQSIVHHKATAERRREALSDLLKGIEDRYATRTKNINERIAELEAELKEAAEEVSSELTETREQQEELAQADYEQAAAMQAELDKAPPLPEPIDAGALQEQITQARTTNANVTKAAEKSKLTRAAAQFEARAQALTDAMEAREKAKAEAIAAGSLPVPGLGFGKDEKGGPIVTLNGLPFDQASDAEQLRTSIAIAMAQNPKLRVIRVRDGNGMDADAMADLERMANEANCQVWIETVRSDGRMAFVIEDGKVKEPTADDDADPVPVADKLL